MLSMLIRNWLKRVDEVPMIYPALSNPAIHLSLFPSTPLEKLEPTYARGANPYSMGSCEPISQGLNSKTVALREMRVSPGARPSATMIGIGMFPSVNRVVLAIDDHVYAISC